MVGTYGLMEFRAVCSAKDNSARRPSCFHGSGVTASPSACDVSDVLSPSPPSSRRRCAAYALHGSFLGGEEGVLGGCVGNVWYLWVDCRRMGRIEATEVLRELSDG